MTKGEAVGGQEVAFGGSLVLRHEAYCWTNWSSELTRPVGPTNYIYAEAIEFVKIDRKFNKHKVETHIG